ncbi:hypothetical protein PR202_gb15444 [Eleusine coracana subsp. coracana]|uniref:Uncharacterized protein n=1 Tax=Eleusine coracana subsp. coracana TaxID=191504 RepID=A0AAV5EZ44_ELECO|nr:hypothetical protein QOZ80_4BG0346420 [Eleusine coracana subsp. coracana]GJN27420.1 hypothetical protein PR202_gb15444 [Eleusine coracana subsp. coracana]
MMLQPFRHGFLPFSDALGGVVANLYTSTSILDVPSYGGGEFVDGKNTLDFELDVNKPVDLDVKDMDPLELDYLLDAASNVHASDLVLPCVCNGCSVPSILRESHPKQRKAATDPQQNSSSFRRLVARHEQLLTFAVVVATLQLFLHLSRANATALILPMLSRAGGAVLALVNAAGVLGSAVTTKRHGREATCGVSAALIVFCQVGVPELVGAHVGLGGFTSTTTTACHAAVACAVSCGLGWAWGALFWASPGPGEGIRSAGPAALGFAQMHCSLLTLRRLRHAALAYYAARIWS